MQVHHKSTIDVILCIDVTGDNTPFVESFKMAIPGIGAALTEKFVEGRFLHIKDIRVRIIAFRDFEFTGEEDGVPMECSPFFSLKFDENDLIEWVRNMTAGGGGDIPECSLEALAEAYASPFNEREHDRTAILLFTNALPKPYGTGKDHYSYPKDIPESFDELCHRIESFQHRVRTLIVGPECEEYRKIADCSRYVQFIPIEQRFPLRIDQTELIRLIDGVACSATPVNL